MADYEAVQRGLSVRINGETGGEPGEKGRTGGERGARRTQQKAEERKKRGLDKRHPAQVAYERSEKRQMERILKKASKTHKQRVEDFNRHLDTLTEHYDIPKVSWTK
uniref:Family with sequence similarity 32 member A n=1 Tax=Malurus cyaneus samueli TaxID=2593467 RepID=A0A8C5TD75_9PASS